MFRFSLDSMLVVVFFVAVGSAALANPTDLWRQSFSQDRTRLFAGGFALTGWLYMMLAFVSILGLRDDLLTDKAIQWLDDTIHGDDGVANSGQAMADFDNDGLLDLYVTLGNGTFRQMAPSLPNMTTIGHALWAIIVGWLGGVGVLWLQRKATQERQQSEGSGPLTP